MADDLNTAKRIAWIDAARAMGMFLVYYGHFVERVGDMGNPLALVQQKLIYSFHMPLFIVLSGLLAKTELPRIRPFLSRQAATRLLPVVFFSLLMLPIEPLLHAALPSSRFRPTQISERWMRDWTDICQRLAPPHQHSPDAARARLWSLLPAPIQAIVSTGARGRRLERVDKQAVAAALDTLLAREELFGPEHFASLEFPRQVKGALGEHPPGDDPEALRHRNWVLTWWSINPGSRFFRQDRAFWPELWSVVQSTLRGYPVLNWLTWFLICLFTVELIHFVAAPFLTSVARLAAAIPLFLVAGALATADVGRMGDFWFARESVLLYAFYLCGMLLRRSGILERTEGMGWRWAIFVVSAAALLLTFDLNPGADYKPVVLVNLSQHGHVGWFVVTAVTGSLCVISLARLLPGWRLLGAIGRHTVILLGLNEIYFASLNQAIARAVDIPVSGPPILIWCTMVTVGSMAACAPAIWLMSRYVPQLVGKPRSHGPLLPQLVS